MPIIRKNVGEYERWTKKKKPLLTERKAADHDLAWGNHRVYVIDANEWFDPHTSSKYVNGVSRHAMIGPSVITVQETEGGGLRTEETYVNDPSVWAWIRRSIAEGHLTAETQLPGLNNEQQIIIN